MPDRLYFTDSDDANALIADDPMALLVGFALDQQVTVQKAFSGPLAIRERVGTLDPAKLAAPTSSRCSARSRRSTASPGRWPSACTISPSTSATSTTATPRACGADAKDAAQLRANLAGLPGFGEMKVKALGAVLAKRYGVKAAQELVPPHPTLGDVDSPQALADYQAAKRLHKARVEWHALMAWSPPSRAASITDVEGEVVVRPSRGAHHSLLVREQRLAAAQLPSSRR